MQAEQVLLVGHKSAPIWTRYIRSGAVPELISPELISLAEWLILFVWAARRSEMVLQLLDPSGFTSGQLRLCLRVATMCSQSSCYVCLWSPLWKQMQFEAHESKSTAGSGAGDPFAGGKGAVCAGKLQTRREGSGNVDCRSGLSNFRTSARF